MRTTMVGSTSVGTLNWVLEKASLGKLVFKRQVELFLQKGGRSLQVDRTAGGGVQLPSRVQLFMTPRTAAYQASLSLTISRFSCTGWWILYHCATWESQFNCLGLGYYIGKHEIMT